MPKPTFKEAMEWHRNAELTRSTGAPSYQFTQAIIDHYMLEVQKAYTQGRQHGYAEAQDQSRGGGL